MCHFRMRLVMVWRFMVWRFMVWHFMVWCFMMWCFKVWYFMVWSGLMVMLCKFSLVVLYFMSRRSMTEFMHRWVFMEVLMLIHMEWMIEFSEHFV